MTFCSRVRIRFIGIVCLFLNFISIDTFAFPVEVSDAPTNDLALTVSAIHSARSSLLVNIYELTSPEIVAAIQERVLSGVHVEMIEEGQPVGGISAAAKQAQAKIVEAMHKARQKDHFYEMTSKARAAESDEEEDEVTERSEVVRVSRMSEVKRRFRFNHAKYIVVDDLALLIGSENYSPTGQPVVGKLGNRGWEVLIHDASIAQEFKSIFYNDCNTSHGDIVDRVIAAHDFMMSPFAFNFTPLTDVVSALREGGRHRGDISPEMPFLKKQPNAFEVSTVSKLTSPETSLSGLVSLLGQAQSSLDLELLSLDLNWGQVDKKSPLLDAIIDASRRGVQVRVLLNDQTAFIKRGGIHGESSFNNKNLLTVNYLNQIASHEKLGLNARIANVKAMGVDYIHNKGALIDEDKTLISSINWGRNSIENNREAGVVLISPEVHDHYKALFDQDWNASRN